MQLTAVARKAAVCNRKAKGGRRCKLTPGPASPEDCNGPTTAPVTMTHIGQGQSLAQHSRAPAFRPASDIRGGGLNKVRRPHPHPNPHLR
jgi:hypothetical protein